MISAIEVDAVTRRFGPTIAVNDVSLSVGENEFLSLLGPSGCGKTTLLRLIGGFEFPDAGFIRLHGQDVTDQPPNLRRTNMVFQHLALFPHMTVEQNIAFGLTIAGRHGAAEIRRKVDDALALVRLPGFGARRIDQLSGGQKQRVAIARAMVNEPAALLLDEPLGALDLRLRLELQAELRRLQRQLRSPFIFVTHDQTEAMALSDRIALMDAGRIVQIGTPRQIYLEPNSLFAARFIGMTNLVEGEVTQAAAGMAALDAQGLSIQGRTPETVTIGQRAVAVIRYEAVTVTDSNAATGVRGKVIDIAFMGSTCRVSVRLHGDVEVIAEFHEAQRSELRIDAEVKVAFDAQSALIFPASR